MGCGASSHVNSGDQSSTNPPAQNEARNESATHSAQMLEKLEKARKTLVKWHLFVQISKVIRLTVVEKCAMEVLGDCMNLTAYMIQPETVEKLSSSVWMGAHAVIASVLEDSQGYTLFVCIPRNWLQGVATLADIETRLESFRQRLTAVMHLLQCGDHMCTFQFTETHRKAVEDLDRGTKALQADLNCASLEELLKQPEGLIQMAGFLGFSPNGPTSFKEAGPGDVHIDIVTPNADTTNADTADTGASTGATTEASTAVPTGANTGQ